MVAIGEVDFDPIRRILSERQGSWVSDSSLNLAGVMMLIYKKDGAYHLLFNKRSQEVEHHKGEISFPGGVIDEADSDMLACALRETWEEMGVLPEDINVLGSLGIVPTITQFEIHAYLGIITYPYPFIVSNVEVAEVVEVPISVLRDVASQRDEVYLLSDGGSKHSTAFSHNNHLIYGATARLVGHFLRLLEDAKASGVHIE
jgi:8-oxo-dGTP pyrophosphatase MutT (NUDIX family)